MKPGIKELSAAGILIRERRVIKKGNLGIEYQVVDGRKIISRHVMFSDALKAAQEWMVYETIKERSQ